MNQLANIAEITPSRSLKNGILGVKNKSLESIVVVSGKEKKTYTSAIINANAHMRTQTIIHTPQPMRVCEDMCLEGLP